MSTLSVSNITDGTDTVETGYVLNGSVKAWDRVGSGVSIFTSFNISSVVDEGGTTTGRIDHNLTSAMDYANYGCAATATGNTDRFCVIDTSSATEFITYGWDGTSREEVGIGAIIMGDLA